MTTDLFSPATRAWVAESFAAPTPAQAGAWRAIADGRDVLVVAPTGSGKTLAAFLWAIDQMASRPSPHKLERLRVLYVSPLKALAADIERNLRSPLAGIRNTAARLGLPSPSITVGMRTGDTPPEERRRMRVSPPDILITTPESLFLMLTSDAREILRSVETVIVDEIHAMAHGKRGSHLAVSLERLDARLPRPARRIGLSATVRPLEEVARLLGGERDVTVVHPPFEKRFDLAVEVPIEDMAEIGMVTEDIPRGRSAAGEPERKTVWPAIEERLVEMIGAHRSTIVFVNSRRLAERLCTRLNETAGAEIARAHHGSVSREQRQRIEEELKSGRLPCVVATSSLELGIDMGSVDLVAHVEAPPSVAAGLQRIGRAGHQVGATSRGVLLPKWRGDLLECAVVVQRMREGAIEALRYPRNPLDVLAQQVVAMVAMDEWTVDDLARLVRRAAPFSSLPQSALEAVLDMLSGRYPSDDFAELRPRLNWDRTEGRLWARPGSQRLAVTSGGTIPDRGLFGVYLVPDENGRGTRVGELDEEMVYETRRGDVFVLGSSTWRVEDITHDRVIVSPAPGEAAKMPFWHGDAPGREVELGRAHGQMVRELSSVARDAALARLQAAGLDRRAAENLLRYLEEQQQATGALPTDRTIVAERFRDELGDWRLAIHSPFGARVHAPWAVAIVGRVRERLGVDVQAIHTDDGILVRLPESDQSLPSDSIIFEPEEIEAMVTEEVGTSALFASRFRECAARALLLPRRRPGSRTPLWQQRQKSANLLSVASSYGSFPVVLETMRECLQDVFDLPALRAIMEQIRSRALRVVQVETERASPFATALLFGYVGAFIYDGDAPLAERRAQALSLDTALLSELLGQAELRDLIDPEALEHLQLSLQRLAPERAVRGLDDAHDALRGLGDLAIEELLARGARPEWVETLERQRRALRVHVKGQERLIAAEDASRYRDALGTVLPPGVPDAFLSPVPDPVGDLVGRFARTHGPFQPSDVAARLGLGLAVVTSALGALERAGKVVRGEFRPGGHGLEWCGSEVLRALRRASLARLRKEAEPVAPEALGRFLPAWHGVGSGARGMEGLLRAVEQLQGVPVPASALEPLLLSARLTEYAWGLLDAACSSGEVTWVGMGSLGTDDGLVALYLSEDLDLLLPPRTEEDDSALSPLARAILESLEAGGALFFRQIADRVGSSTDARLLEAIWELAWAGRITNDTFSPVRAVIGVGIQPATRARARRRPRSLALPSRQGPPAGAGRWSVVPTASVSPADAVAEATRRARMLAEQVLDRHGVVTRESMAVEGVSGGFAAVYPVLKAFEEAGKCRRGYFVEGLGGAQFASPGAVDRLRSMAGAEATGKALVLAATDPANPYGGALAWPERRGAQEKSPEDDRAEGAVGHRPGRKAGALVVLVDGRLALYVERGGKSLLTFSEESAVLGSSVEALASRVRESGLGRMKVERVDGRDVFASPLANVLLASGFRETPRGLVLR